jgi:hypothetical protein
MDTWGRRGFAAAVITGGMIGLSGTGAVAAVPSAQWGGSPEPEPRTPQRPPAGPPATRYGAPEYRMEPREAEYRLPESTEQTVATQAQPPRHANPAYQAAPVAADYPADYPTGGMARVPVATGAHGSDGFLAGNIATLADPPSTSHSGTPIGALGPAEGSLGTGFTSYGTSAPAPEFGRVESRHARPDQPELYAERPAELYAERPAELYAERPAELYGERPAQNYGERPAEQYSERPAEYYGESPAQNYGERPAELYGDRPAELYGDRPVELYGELYADRSPGVEMHPAAMLPRSPLSSMSQPAVPLNEQEYRQAYQQPTGYQMGHQPMQQPAAPVHQQMGLPMSYPAERPVRAVELVGAAYPQGAHSSGPERHGEPGQSLDSDTSALGSLDSSALFGSLSRPPR